ncbi:MAG: hypothetical protein ACJ793_13965 [Gemmatimonadaceae bacterium]
MKAKRHRHFILALAAIAGVAMIGTVRSAEAQIHPSFYGSAEADTRNVQFYLLGMYVGMGGLGWTPYFDVNGWLLNYPIAGERENLSAINPTVGLAYATNNGGVSVGVGYSWVNNPVIGVPGAATGGENGVTASFGAYHNGTGRRALNTQFLSQYNFGSHYGWGRLRGSVPLGYSARHPTRIGLELVGQGGGRQGITTNQFDIGPTLEYAWTPKFSTTGVIGYRNVGGSDLAGFTDRESAAYFKLEFSFSP